MKKLLPLIGILLLSTFSTAAQSLPCGNGRFVSGVFPSATVTPAVLYGRNTTYAGVVQDLRMDIFQPTGDVAAIRPLFIFAFGGSFVSGDRTQLAYLCDSLARKGYVAVAIDYRLYDGPLGIFGLVLNPNDGIDAVAKGMSDIKAAIRFFKRDAATTKTYRIDTANIFVGGISSGSMAALHTTYINSIAETVAPVSTIITANGGIQGNTDLPGTPLLGTYSFAGIRGVWNMSGALYDSGYIKAGDAALFGIHGTADDVVPFGYGQLFSGVTNLGQFVSGSSSLHNQANNVGVQTKLLPVIGGDHVNMYFDPATLTSLDTSASRYFGNIVCPGTLPVTGIYLKANVANKHIELSWQTLTETDSKGFLVEKQTTNGWKSVGEITSKAANGYSVLPLGYSFIDVQPENGYNTYRLKMISLNGNATYSNTTKVVWKGGTVIPFVIYPNPVNAVLYAKTTLTSTGTLKIYSPVMRLIQTHIVMGSQGIAVSALSDGLYLGILFDHQNKQAGSSWFIKK